MRHYKLEDFASISGLSGYQAQEHAAGVFDALSVLCGELQFSVAVTRPAGLDRIVSLRLAVDTYVFCEVVHHHHPEDGTRPLARVPHLKLVAARALLNAALYDATSPRR